MADPAPVLVIGVGNEFRGDDGAATEVARRLRKCASTDELDVEEEQSDPTELIERWQGRNAVILVDTVAGAEAGSVERFDAANYPQPVDRQ